MLLGAHDFLSSFLFYSSFSLILLFTFLLSSTTNPNLCSAQIQINILMCIEKVIENLDKTEILDDVLPMIMRARTQDASVLIIVISE